MKNQLVRIIILVVFTASLSFMVQSCAVASMPETPMTFSNTSSKGLLVGTVTFPTDKPKLNGYFFRLTNNSSQEFQINRNVKGQLDEGRTYVFAIERPVGVYEIPSVRMFHNSVIMAGQYDVRIGGFSIPYEIKKGEITYLGNITLNDYAQTGEKVVGLNNQFARDIDALKKLQRQVNWNDVKNDETRKIEYNDKKARL